MKNEKQLQPIKRGRHRRDEPSGRESLLKAAKREFADEGFEQANLRSIAKSAGVDPGLVRVLFGSKEGLWNACMDAILNEALPLLNEVQNLSDKKAPAVERLHAMILTLAKFYWNHREVRQFVIQQSTEGGERTQGVIDRLVRPLYTALSPVLEEAAQKGSIRSLHPVLFFSLLMSALNWPKAVPALVHNLDSSIELNDVPDLLVENALVALLQTENGNNRIVIRGE